MHFCQTCIGCLCEHKGYTDLWGPDMWLFHHHFNTESLERSAGEGCMICTLLWHDGLSIAGRPKSTETPDPGVPLTALMLYPDGSKSAVSLYSEGDTVLLAFTNSDTSQVACGDGAVMHLFYLTAERTSMHVFDRSC